MYVHDIEVGTTVLKGKPEVMNETSATALVDGNNLLGPPGGGGGGTAIYGLYGYVPL